MKNKKVFINLFIIGLLFLVFSSLFQYVYLPHRQLQGVENCSPVNFRKESIESSYYILWSTKSECSGYVKYGVNDNDFPYLALDLQGVVKIKEHKVSLTGIEKGDKYFFVIFSDEKMYGQNEVPIEIQFD